MYTIYIAVSLSFYLFVCIIYVALSSTSTLLIGYYHGLLLRDTNVDSLIVNLYSIGVLSAQEQNMILSGYSSHHRNWLLLEHVRRMNSKNLLAFCELVKDFWPQIGMQLVTGTYIRIRTYILMIIFMVLCLCLHIYKVQL